jgi:hypothetical protein
VDVAAGQFQYAVQYLEGGPGVAGISPDAARRKLRAAAERLPISMVLLGWGLPPALRDACAEETRCIGASLYRWHPLLSGDGTFVPRPEWRAESLAGGPIAGFRDMPEFTFVCPNRAGVADAVLSHLDECLEGGIYDGVFLDRIRYPSPLADPPARLGCFCADCARAGLDVSAADLFGSPAAFVVPLFRECGSHLENFLRFRAASITDIVGRAAALARARGLKIGLDCFSPVLTRAVAQDLAALDGHADWIKLMTYGHTFAPAGLPFELDGAVQWLVRAGVPEASALRTVSEAAGIALPSGRAALKAQGIAPGALAAEIQRARSTGVKAPLAGMELVAVEDVTSLNPEQIRADARAFRASATGVVLSWDLWHIPLGSLDLLT